tara:strand:- start:538 stop:657 length:120 start_codon:yes stop_codon:yes gene_type:complete
MQIKSTTPILRSFDENKAKEFYVDFLEFEIWVINNHRIS